MQSTSKKFRETLWFKKGVLDVEEAHKAAAQEDDLQSGAVDMLPVEDRYLDDGTVTREDSLIYSIRTGNTQFVPLITDAPERKSLDRLGPLVREMKGRRAVLAVLGASIATVCTIILVYAL